MMYTAESTLWLSMPSPDANNVQQNCMTVCIYLFIYYTQTLYLGLPVDRWTDGRTDRWIDRYK